MVSVSEVTIPNCAFIHDDLSTFNSIITLLESHLDSKAYKHIHFQYHHAFGHNISQAECLSRVIPNSLCVIFLPQQANHFIPLLYTAVDFIAVRVNIPLSIPELYSRLSLLHASFLHTHGSKFSVTCGEEIYFHIQKRLSIPPGPLHFSNDLKCFTYRHHHYYEQLFYQQCGSTPTLPPYLKQHLHDHLIRSGLYDLSNVFFINLRFHGTTSPSPSTSLRDTQYSTHLSLAIHIAELGYQVILYHHPSIPIPYHPRIFSFYRLVPSYLYYLLSLYLLLFCELYIGAHSGPIVLRGSVYQRSLISDSFPFYLGSLNSGDTVLTKNLLYQGKPLPFTQLLLDKAHRKAFFSSSLDNVYQPLPNTYRQLADALEMHLDSTVNRSQLKHKQNHILEHASLDSSPLYFHKSLSYNLTR